MRKTRSWDVLPADPEIERTLTRLRQVRRANEQDMAEENNNNQARTLRDYYRPVVNENYSGIRRQVVNTNNFELKPALINMVQQNQYGGLPSEDPNIHLAIFLEICDTIKMNKVPDDVIRLRLFPFSLRDKARGWLQSLQPGSITTWEELA